MEHSTGTPTNATPHAPLDPPPATTPTQAATQAQPTAHAHATTQAQAAPQAQPTTHAHATTQAQAAAQAQAHAATGAQAAAQARAERQARADWLITELSRLAAQAEDPNDRVRIRRTADSLTRLATAFRQ